METGEILFYLLILILGFAITGLYHLIIPMIYARIITKRREIFSTGKLFLISFSSSILGLAISVATTFDLLSGATISFLWMWVGFAILLMKRSNIVEEERRRIEEEKRRLEEEMTAKRRFRFFNLFQ